MRLLNSLMIFSALSFANFVQAHNIWLEPTQQSNHYVVKFGHEQTETYPKHKLKSVEQLNEDGSISTLAYQFNNGEAYLDIPHSTMVFLQFDNGIWSKLPSGKYVEKTKKEEPTAEFSLNPVKLGKAILVWNEQAFKSHQQDYELIPQAKAQVGKPLEILVLHNGKPVPNIKVGLGEDQPFSLTNEKGMVQFNSVVRGYNKVWAEFEEKVEGNPDYTDRSFEYMLTFFAE